MKTLCTNEDLVVRCLHYIIHKKLEDFKCNICSFSAVNCNYDRFSETFHNLLPR